MILNGISKIGENSGLIRKVLILIELVGLGTFPFRGDFWRFTFEDSKLENRGMQTDKEGLH